MSTTRVIDVSHLPASSFDARSPLWWGNLWMLAIETTMFGILVASYFYFVMNFGQWPPPRVNQDPVLYDTNPDLLPGTINVLLMLASCVPMFFADRAARQKNRPVVKRMLVICILLSLIMILLRVFEFHGVHFRWDDNAYASTVWTLLGTHLIHLLVAMAECVFLANFVFQRSIDDSHALDVTVTAVYWYWVAAIWVPLYTIIYFAPRFL